MARQSTKPQKGGFLETVKTVVIAILIAVIFRTFIFQPFWIPSGSMKSTLLIGDYLFVSKYSYGFSRHSFPWSFPPFEGRIFGSTPERGDVIVFKHPRTGDDYVKRVIGLPGDRIQVKGSVVYINDTPMQQEKTGFFVEEIVPGQTRCIDRKQIGGTLQCVKDALRETLPEGRSYTILNADANLSRTDNTGVFTVPEGEFFFMGDNRDNSSDSRMGLGFVPFENLVGRVEIIAVSADGPFWELWNWRFVRILDVVR